MNLSVISVSRNGNSTIVAIPYNRNDVRHVIRHLGDRFTLTSIAQILGVSVSSVSMWCKYYGLSGLFPPRKHHAKIFKLAEDVANNRTGVMRRLVSANAPLSPITRYSL